MPRPDWYFYFLFYLLRIFKWPDSVILGTVGIPTIIMVLMLALPFLDRRQERRLSRRPVAVVITILTVIAMGTLTYKGATAKEALASELASLPPVWAKKQGFEGNAQALAGASLFAQAGCQQCHTYLGTGSSNLGAPDLSEEGTRGRGRPGAGRLHRRPEQVRQQRDAEVRGAVHEGTDRVDRDLPGRLEGREVETTASVSGSSPTPIRFPVQVFLGVTGASGALYAARLLEALTEADCEVGLCISGAGLEVIATELYGDARLSRDETIARFTARAHGLVTVFDPQDWRAPYASGSAKIDGYVICPCSMGTLGAIASGAMSNLIHRAASVALKEERKLILMPRETPLSAIHLQNMLTLRQAGATILFLAPGFYHGAETVDDLADFMAGRALDLLGLDNALVTRWGR